MKLLYGSSEVERPLSNRSTVPAATKTERVILRLSLVSLSCSQTLIERSRLNVSRQKAYQGFLNTGQATMKNGDEPA